MQLDRKKLIESLATDSSLDGWNDEHYYAMPGDALGDNVKAHFDKAVEEGYGDEGYLTYDATQAKSIIWSVDNVDSFTRRSIFFNCDDIYPVESISFEGDMFCGPHDPDAVLHTIFGDYLSLPDDIGARSFHITEEQLENEAFKAYISEIAAKHSLD